MRSPQNVSKEQYTELEKAGKLKKINEKQRIQIRKFCFLVLLPLPSQAVSFIKISW